MISRRRFLGLIPAAAVTLGLDVKFGEAPKARRRRLKAAGQTFADFHVGKSNELAYEVSRSFAEGDFRDPAIPLYISGEPGMGKTHLLNAIAHRARELGSKPADLRFVDGLDFIAKGESAQDELLVTLDMIAGCRRPWEIEGLKRELLERELLERVESGLVVRIHEPDREFWEELLCFEAKRQGVRLEGKLVARILAGSRTKSYREIQGMVTRVRLEGEVRVGVISGN